MSYPKGMHTVTLENFQGPVDFLLHLIQKSELDVCAISLTRIIHQYFDVKDKNLDASAEFIATAASLLLIKSKALLPRQETENENSEEIDSRYEIIQNLMEYCRFKELAKELQDREENRTGAFSRGADEWPMAKKPLGIDHLTLEDLGSLFQQVLAKAASNKGQIHQEIWLVSDKIIHLRNIVTSNGSIAFTALFMSEMDREELIVTFLALLELMKMGELLVTFEKNDALIHKK